MAEMSKEFKILLLANTIVAFIYGFMYLVIPDILSTLIEPTNYDPHFWQLWGGTCISLGILGLIGLKRGDWEKIKILIEFMILWLILALIVNFISLIITTHSAAALASQWLDNIVIIVIIVVDSYFYLREQKLAK